MEKLSELMHPQIKQLVDISATLDPHNAIPMIYDMAGQRNDAATIYYIGKNYMKFLPERQHNVVACAVMSMDRFESGSITEPEMVRDLEDAIRDDIRSQLPGKTAEEVDMILGMAQLHAALPPELREAIFSRVPAGETERMDIKGVPGGGLDLSAFGPDFHPGSDTKH